MSVLRTGDKCGLLVMASPAIALGNSALNPLYCPYEQCGHDRKYELRKAFSLFILISTML